MIFHTVRYQNVSRIAGDKSKEAEHRHDVQLWHFI